MLKLLDNGKWMATWAIGTVSVNGHAVTGRPETLLALTGAVPAKLVPVFLVGTREECDRQVAA